MSDTKRMRLTLTVDKDTNIGRLYKAAVEYMESEGIEIKSASFAELPQLKKTASRLKKKISKRVEVK